MCNYQRQWNKTMSVAFNREGIPSSYHSFRKKKMQQPGHFCTRLYIWRYCSLSFFILVDSAPLKEKKGFSELQWQCSMYVDFSYHKMSDDYYRSISPNEKIKIDFSKSYINIHQVHLCSALYSIRWKGILGDKVTRSDEF